MAPPQSLRRSLRLWFLLVFSALNLCAGLSFVEHPVSATELAPAAGSQQAPLIASNGDISLAVWLDYRTPDRPAVYATRLNREGVPLDSAGIEVARNAFPEAVVWNGEQFAIFTGSSAMRSVVFVGSDGSVGEKRNIAPNGDYVLLSATSNGGDARAIFVATRSPEPAVLVLDGRGEVVAPAFLLPAIPDPYNQYFVAGAGSSEFLVLRSAPSGPAPGSLHTIAYRITFDGRLLSSAESLLPVFLDPYAALAGGSDGYAVIHQAASNKNVNLFRLDRDGVFRGAREILLAGPPNTRAMTYQPVIARAGDHYVAAFHSSFGNGHSYTYAAEIPVTGSATMKQLDDWLGITTGIAVVPSSTGAQVLTAVNRLGYSTFNDIYGQRIGNGLESSPVQAVALSPSVQTNPAIASGLNGALVAWTEQRSDEFTRIMVRRVAADGTPQDAGPAEAARFPIVLNNAILPPPNVTSNGATYLVSWSMGNVEGRRFSAQSGEWIDAQPFSIGDGGDAVVATNGEQALAAWTGVCPGGAGACIQSRPIAFSGDPLLTPVSVVTSAGYPYDLALASDGSDYLVAWSEGFRDCVILCPPLDPFKIETLRLRTDGTRVDSQPALTGDGQAQGVKPTAVWNGDHYTLAWSTGQEIRGVRLTRQGASLDATADPAGTIIQGPESAGLEPHLFARSGELLLLSKRTVVKATTQRSVAWQLVIQNDSAGLSELLAKPRVSLINDSDFALSALDLTPLGGSLLIAYTRSDAGTGGVARVLVRSVPDQPRRRPSGH
jgi:hypothetical protein